MSDPGHHTVLLIHGLGATGAVWHGVERELRAAGLHTLAPDLPGHGAEPPPARYELDVLARTMARHVPAGRSVLVAGHSLGGYVALALAGGGFGFTPRAALSVGAKLNFSEPERARASEIATKPVRWFATRDEALARYRLVAGLPESIAPDLAYLERGVVQGAGGWRLTTDPAAFAIVVPAFTALHAAARCRVAVARGEGDTMVSRAECDASGLHALHIGGLGHNAHVEGEATIAALVRGMLERG